MARNKTAWAILEAIVAASETEGPGCPHPTATSRAAVCSVSSGRPGPCSGAGRGWPPAQPWSQPDR
jgi:hypothetical protein